VHYAKAVGRNEMPFDMDTRVAPNIGQGPGPLDWNEKFGGLQPQV